MPLGIPHSVFLAWDELDQDKAISWRREQAKVCPTCRTRKAEWAADKTAYIGHIEQCPGCEVLEMERENLQDVEQRGNGAKGLQVTLVPKAVHEHMTAEQQLATKGT